jgi:hypothetical protein
MRAEFFTLKDRVFATVAELQVALDAWASAHRPVAAVLPRSAADREVPAREPPWPQTRLGPPGYLRAGMGGQPGGKAALCT